MKILISGPNSFNLDRMIQEGFASNNHSVELFSWPDYSEFNQLNLLIYKFKTKINFELLDCQVINDQKVKEYNINLYNKIMEGDYDILFIVHGTFILPQFFQKINNKKPRLKVVLWCMDSALLYKNILNTGKYYDLFYTFEPSDIPRLKEYNIEATYLPLGYDPKTFFPLENRINEYDISFVGILFPDRKRLFDELLRENPNLNFKIWGKQWSCLQPENYLDYKLHRYRLKKCIDNFNILPVQANKIYNHTKICLNFHHKQSVLGLNPRFFEIFGSGAFQLVDYKPVIDTLFDYKSQDFCFMNKKDLNEKIYFYLEHEKERNRIAKDMHEIIKNQHTYHHRVEKILSDLKKIEE